MRKCYIFIIKEKGGEGSLRNPECDSQEETKVGAGEWEGVECKEERKTNDHLDEHFQWLS